MLDANQTSLERDRFEGHGSHVGDLSEETPSPATMEPPMSLSEAIETVVASLEGNGAEMAAGGPSVGEKLESTAATKVQKVYRSYRTRRKLADTAVVAEELWWQAFDFARLSYSTLSFFNYTKPEKPASRWNRVSLNASKVGQGLSKDGKALKLAFEHWIEAIDPRHRYGHNLHIYYEKWCESDAGQPFFYWLDLGEGRNVDLISCSRSLLRQQCIKYLGLHERTQYEYVPLDGKIVHKQSAEPLDTTKDHKDAKWIFVMCTSRRLYAGKGLFHHSSFLAGGSTIAAGRLTVENGIPKEISAYSGHYKPSEENLGLFLNYLTENGIDTNQLVIGSSSNEDYQEDKIAKTAAEVATESLISMLPPLQMPVTIHSERLIELDNTNGTKAYKRTLSGGLQSPKTDLPEKAILERIKSKREFKSYQLGHQLSLKWCTGAGPRIGCIADYPPELRTQALEFTNLSPRMCTTPVHSQRFSSCPSPLSRGSSSYGSSISTALRDGNGDGNGNGDGKT
ncbi:hypothetical protein HPP92_006020 [Vanilla planifolia]|uniref:IQ domain-containing protein IQM3 n=1 Tax=Vanilla planifolia TaxID=51239 RepID=A0A835RIJ4_VANPL|nr:hypothetical protein HPP92_006348 [Vanilla planifolia]KAG0495026.1 hypothetical protein HPP92_006020 [Vanilla planifolia]